MEWSFVFFLISALLCGGLAMDAFSVSMANGLHDPRMSRGTMCRIAGTIALYQAVMPMTGWVCVHAFVELFSSFEKFIPWIALALLGYIGGKMLVDGIKGEEAEEAAELSAGALFMQGVATSIDALSVGFTISEYGWFMALVCSLIVAIVAFFICGSEKVSQISLTSSIAKKRSMISIFVRKKATFFMPDSSDSVAPVHMRAPFISTPMKFFSGNMRPNPTVYSPLPQPSSRTMGWSFLKNRPCQFPFMSNGTLSTAEYGYSKTCG